MCKGNPDLSDSSRKKHISNKFPNALNFFQFHFFIEAVKRKYSKYGNMEKSVWPGNLSFRKLWKTKKIRFSLEMS
jgi:hypothetical protein